MSDSIVCKLVEDASRACLTQGAAMPHAKQMRTKAQRVRRWLHHLVLVVSAALVFQPVHAQSTGGTARTGLNVSVPNGYATIGMDDMQVTSTAGQVRWLRVWDGHEWKFNPQWESLSQSWANLTGSQTPDTTPGTVPGKSVESSGGGGGGGGGEGCWMWVDEDWQPTYKTKTGDDGITIVVEVGPMVPLRTTPFNRVMGEVVDDYITLRIVAPSMIGSGGGGCGGGGAAGAGTAFGGGSDNEAEGIRRINELYLGEKGRYAFNNRSILEKRPVQQLPSGNAGSLYAAIATGKIALAPATNAKGYHWMDRGGDWIDYNTQGQIVAWGDRNNNIVWLQRESGGKVLAAIDANGRVLFSLHYSGELITEVRDYPIAGLAGDLPARSVKYRYDDMNRLVQVTDVRGNTMQYAYDGRHNIVQVTDQEGRAEKLAYSDQTVKQRIAPDGGVTDYLFEYDDVNKQFISKITGPETAAGRRVEDFTHNRVGKLVRQIVNGRTEAEVRYDTGARSESRTNARGFTTRNTKNEFDQRVEIAHPDGTSVKRSYSALHLGLTEQTDELGVKDSYQYDAKGNLLKRIEAAGTRDERTTEYALNAQGQISQFTRKGRTEATGTITPDAVWTIDYDAQGQLAKITDPEGGTRRFAFDRAGNVISVTDARGNTMRYVADTDGRLLKVTDALSREWRYAYDKVGNLVSTTDAKGKATLIAYDTMNRRVQTTNPVSGIAKTQYNAAGLLVKTEDEDGQVTTLDYDNFQRIAKQADALNNVTTFGYQLADDSGQPGSLESPTETRYPTLTEQTRYDERERPTSRSLVYASVAGATQTSNFARAYDNAGRVKSETNPYGKTHTYTYDAQGHVTAATDALNGKTQAQYDARGNLIALTDAKGNTTRLAYDRNNRLVKETLPLGQTTSYQYDLAGNLAGRTDALGNRTIYDYDAANRLVAIKHIPSGAGDTPIRTTTYSWDEADNLTAWTDTDLGRPTGQQTASATLTYDNANRKTGETVSYPTPNGSYSLAYTQTHSPAGKKTSLTWPDGSRIDYGYSAHGELQSVAIPGEGAISINQFQWLAPSLTTYPGGSTKTQTWDGLLQPARSQLKTPGQQTLQSLQHTWGLGLDLKTRQRSDTLDGATSSRDTAYRYDDENRLTQVQTDTGGLFGTDTETYSLDAVGNRIAHSKTGGAWTYDANNRLTQRGDGTSYQYDANGNRTQKTENGKTTRYAYDTQNRLVEISDASGPVARYGYDPLSHRLWKEQYRDRAGNPIQAKRTLYLYSDEGLIAEAEQAITLNGDGSVSASQAPIIQTQYGPKPGNPFTTGVLFVKTKNSNGEDVVAYYQHDHLGTPTQAIDKTGRIVWAAQYDAYGAATIVTSNATQDKPTISSNLRLPGQYEDSETGLHYNWHRYYDKDVGAYLTADPIGLRGGVNRFGYVNGDPVGHMDSMGLASDGVPLNSMNCEALKRLLDYDDTHSKTETILKYNTLNFSDDMIALDASFPSLGGPVSIDWMMRSAGAGATSLPGISFLSYGFQKSWWNIANGAPPWKNMANAPNWNAPSALSSWLYGDMSLRQLFGPAMSQCECGK